jgi:hypothetical protein
MNVEKFKMMGISRQASPIQIILDQTELENVKYLICVGCKMKNDARCTRRAKSSIAIAKAEFNKNSNLFNSQFDLLKKETITVLHLEY